MVLAANFLTKVAQNIWATFGGLFLKMSLLSKVCNESFFANLGLNSADFIPNTGHTGRDKHKERRGENH